MSNISSPPLRLELNPSRWLGAALLALALLGAIAVLRSALPPVAVVVLPVLAWVAWSGQRRRGTVSLLFRADASAARLLADAGEVAIEPRALLERGPLAVLVFAEAGRLWRLPCGPDVLDARRRRELRLWFERHGGGPRGAARPHEVAHV